MKAMEQIELDAYRKELTTDVGDLVEKYRKIFDWDIPEVDQQAANKLILAAIRKALDDIESQ
ncbi:MAG: hypothetical protein ABL873_07350 [Gallionella sp.]|nr:hypothetical protein [Gallionella sp.]